jgi:hypothetical protein
MDNIVITNVTEVFTVMTLSGIIGLMIGFGIAFRK